MFYLKIGGNTVEIPVSTAAKLRDRKKIVEINRWRLAISDQLKNWWPDLRYATKIHE